VHPHIRFGAEVLAARWDAEAKIWQVDTNTGSLAADILVAAAGPLHEPDLPAVEGLDRFRGTMFHSARWDHDRDLTGERVAVIGTGASAIQFVPEIQRTVGHLHLYQRTAPWVLPKLDFPIPWLGKQVFHRLPVTERLAREGVYLAHEAAGIAFRDARIMRCLHPAARSYLRSEVRDPELRRALTPRFTLGCKRVLLSTSYYRALTRDNVTVHPTGLEALGDHEVVGADGTRTEVDTVIFATGFEVAHPPVSRLIFDGAGDSLAGAWSEHPSAYLGTVVAGFPNLFLLLGPNIVPGHASVLTTVEAQARYIAEAARAMDRRGGAPLEVRHEVAARLDRDVQAALAGTVYNDGCSSYYLAGGRNIANWPWSLARLHRRLHFEPADYHEPSEASGTAGSRS
jgi:cyclohexanone monooxygenase